MIHACAACGRYVKSRDDAQLRGEPRLGAQLETCEPERYLAGDTSKLIDPCGLVAWSTFNDTFQVHLWTSWSSSPRGGLTALRMQSRSFTASLTPDMPHDLCDCTALELERVILSAGVCGLQHLSHERSASVQHAQSLLQPTTTTFPPSSCHTTCLPIAVLSARASSSTLTLKHLSADHTSWCHYPATSEQPGPCLEDRRPAQV